MTVSQPSKEIYSVDIPEVFGFSAVFDYNFFTPNESIDDSGEVPQNVLTKNSTMIDANFIQFATTRAPRFVRFSWKPISVSTTGRQLSDDDMRKMTFDGKQHKGILARNILKVITEDVFASYEFVSVNFHDAKLDEKIHQLVSGSYEQHTVGTDYSRSLLKNAKLLQTVFPTNSNVISKGLTNSSATGTQFVIDKGMKQADTTTTRLSRLFSSKGSLMLLTSQFFRKLHHVNVDAQINSRLLSDITDKIIKDPVSPFTTDMRDMRNTASTIQKNSRANLKQGISQNDYQKDVPYIDLQTSKASHVSQRQQVEVVGYIIDKSEITPGGNLKRHPPIIVEGTNNSVAIDFKVKYSSIYQYTIRSVCQVKLPAIDSDSGEVAMLTILVSSRPSTVVSINTREMIAPPPPANLNFVWNYELDKLMLLWDFPTNSQQDIKKFQIFRRKSIDHPFELLKMFDFDDSAVKAQSNEVIQPRLIQKLTSPNNYYLDDEFVFESDYIYAVASIDAHGLTSNYSEQFRVTFDQFRNKISKSLVSHSGAPKQYPNMYLEKDMFVDVMKVSGQSSKSVKIYLNPEHYKLIDSQGRITNLLQTDKTGGSYVVQFMNTDNQKLATLDVTISDKTDSGRKIVATNKNYYGPSVKLST